MQTARVFKFGLRRPSPETCKTLHALFVQAHKYRNQLVELEHKRRAAWEQILADLEPKLPPALAKAKELDLGTNIKGTVEGSILTLRIDLSERHGKSASGKTTIVATSAGNKQVDGGGGVVLGINAYVKE